jgi:hypothetical protein
MAVASTGKAVNPFHDERPSPFLALMAKKVSANRARLKQQN